METIQTYKLNNGNRLSIFIDENPMDPRERSDSKLCIREHRHYSFSNELDYDFECEEPNGKQDLSDYFVFNLDCYIHSNIYFSLAWWWMQCRFDTSNDCWFIAMPKSQYESEEIAQTNAKLEIDTYNKYINWEVYWFQETKPVIYTAEDWRTITNWEIVDSCSGYYDIKDMLDEYQWMDPQEIAS